MLEKTDTESSSDIEMTLLLTPHTHIYNYIYIEIQVRHAYTILHLYLLFLFPVLLAPEEIRRVMDQTQAQAWAEQRCSPQSSNDLMPLNAV